MFVQLGVWWLSFSLTVNSQAEIVYDSRDIDDWSDWSQSGDTQAENFNCPPSTSQTYCLVMRGPSSMSQSLSLEGFHDIEIQIVFQQSVSNGEFCQIVYSNDALTWSDPVFQLTNGDPVAEDVMVSLPNDNTVNNQPVFQIKLENTGNGDCSVGKIIIYGIPITFAPTITPTMTAIIPTNIPTINPTFNPITSEPTAFPTLSPTVLPTTLPTILPTISPTILPTSSPSTMFPTILQTIFPSYYPSKTPSQQPSYYPSKTPSQQPSNAPSKTQTDAPVSWQTPSQRPSNAPTNGRQQHVQDFSTTIFESAQDDFESVDANFTGLIIIIIAIVAGLIAFIVFAIGIVYCYQIKTKNTMNKKNQDSMEMVDIGQTTLPISKISSLSCMNSDSDVVCTHGNTPPNTTIDNTNNLDYREAGENDVHNGNGTDDELFYEGDNDDMYIVPSNHDTVQHPTPQHPTPQNNMNVTPQHPLDNDENYDKHGMYTKGNV